MEQADADVEPALHAAAEGLDPIAGALGEADEREDLAHPVLELAAAEPVEPAEEHEVLARREVRVDRELLGDVADARLGRDLPDVDRLAVEGHLARVARQQPADHRDRRRLAGAVGPQQAVGLALVDLEADAADGLERAVALVEVADAQDDRALGDGRQIVGLDGLLVDLRRRRFDGGVGAGIGGRLGLGFGRHVLGTLLRAIAISARTAANRGGTGHALASAGWATRAFAPSRPPRMATGGPTPRSSMGRSSSHPPALGSRRGPRPRTRSRRSSRIQSPWARWNSTDSGSSGQTMRCMPNIGRLSRSSAGPSASRSWTAR